MHWRYLSALFFDHQRHEEAQTVKDRPTLNKLTDPGESLHLFLKDLSHAQPDIFSALKAEILKSKGFVSGKITRESIQTVIRGSVDAQGKL
jgi:hypothetical protein